MPSVAAARVANASSAPSYQSVAVFIGGTSGIGQSMTETFARHTKGNAHIIICGRNQKAADTILASLPKSKYTKAEPMREFVQCDATLMKNVQATTTDLLARLPKINFLVLSVGVINTEGRRETEEGIDKKLALDYYARWKFIHDLMPLLQKAKDAGEDAKVLSVLGAGHGAKPDLDDLGLKKNYSWTKASFQAAPTYTDAMMEEYAAQHPDITFVHCFPGNAVRGPIWRVSNHWAMAPVNGLVYALIFPFSVSLKDCGEYMWHGFLQSQKGYTRRGPKGEDMGNKNNFSTAEVREKLWKHTVETTKVTS